MGADAFIFVFDYSRYRTEVVPAFVTFLKDGSVPGWLTELRRRREQSRYGEFAAPNQELRIVDGIDLSAHCTHLDADLAPAGRAIYSRSLYESDWSDRVCRSSQCPERLRCSFVEARARSTADPEQLLDLLQLGVTQTCLGPCQFLGRSIDALWYWNLLNDIGLPQDDPIR